MVASAGSIDYNTTGSTLSCNGLAGCVHNSPTSLSDGGLTLTYNSATGSGTLTPRKMSVLIVLRERDLPPRGAGEALPNGVLSGLATSDTSGATILFTPNNSTTA